VLRLVSIVLVAAACGKQADEPAKTPPPATPDAAVAKPLTSKPDASNERPPDDKAPPPIVKPVEGDCNLKNADVALVAACEYRCRENKEADACAVGARKYYQGDGIKLDQPRGAELVKLACELESADGCVYLARLDPTKADDLTAKAMTYFERDCGNDLALACIELAERVKGFDEARSKTELQKGLDLATKGCATADGALCFAASKILEIDKDMLRAAELRKRACEGGHAPTCLRLSTETTKEEVRGPLIDKACALGLRKACAQLATELSAKNTTRGAKAIERACQLNEGAWCVRIGEDAAKANDRDKASEMFTKACKAGYDPGCSQARALGVR